MIGSLNAHTDWSKALAGIDAIVHLAARVHVMNETAAGSLAAFRETNVIATEALARAAASDGVRRFVYVSSVKVNGETTGDRPFSRSDNASPADPYGVSKYEAEVALSAVAASTALELTIIRPPLVYGPGVGANFLRLLKLVQRRIPVPLAAVDNRRSMIYNGNLADALLLGATHPDAAGRTYLVSDGEDLSTRELVCRLGLELGRPARLWSVPPAVLRAAAKISGRTAEADRLIGSLVVDSSAMRAELDWRPPYTVDEGLAETARWFAAAQP